MTVAVSAIVAGVVAGVGAYYAGTLSAPVKEVVKEVTRTVTSTTTLAPGAPVTTTVTITPPPTTVTKTVTTTIAATTPTTPTRKAIRLGIDNPGTGSYMVGSLVTDLMRSVFPTYDVSPYPIGGTTACAKEFLKGTVEMIWSSSTCLKLLYAREEYFKDVSKDALLPTHTIYTSRSSGAIVTTQELKEKHRLNSWRDLDGKKAAIMGVKYEAHLWFMRALQRLGINVQHVEMDLEMIADALLKGDIVASVWICIGGAPSPWAMNITTKTKPVMIPLSTEEVKVLENAGLPFGWLSTEEIRKYGVDVLGLDKAFLYSLALGLSTHPKFLSEDEVYKLMKEMITRRDDLAKMTKYFEPFAGDPIGLQVHGISVAPEVPVHPGLAKLLKEYGVWREAWKIAS